MSRRITEAKEEVVVARERLICTAREVQQRLLPKTLAREAWESAKEKGADVVEDAVDAVRKRPYAAGGVVAALALFIAREPVKELLGKLTDAMTSKAPPKGKKKKKMENAS